MCITNFIVENNWTLFLDRDGVINIKKENDYVKNWSEFFFIDGVLEALASFAKLFKTIVIVTNQRGVGKGLMTENELNFIHDQMIKIINENFGRIDKIYYCIEKDDFSIDRKPNIGMALKAKLDFPEIDFRKSIMLGDSITDIIFGSKLNMHCFLIGSLKDINNQYQTYLNLLEFSLILSTNVND